MTSENPYESPHEPAPVEPPTDVTLPLVETVVFDALVLSKYEQHQTSCFVVLLRIGAGSVGCAGLAMLCSFIFTMSVLNNPRSWIVFPIFGIPACALLVWAVYQKQISARLLRRTLRKHGRETEEVQYAITETVLSVTTDTEVRQIPWTSFVGREETEDFVILFLKNGTSQLFPIEQLSEEFLHVVRSVNSSSNL